MNSTETGICGFFIMLWMASWFIGIWIFHLQFFLTGTLSIILGVLYYEAFKESDKKQKYCTNCGHKLECN